MHEQMAPVPEYMPNLQQAFCSQYCLDVLATVLMCMIIEAWCEQAKYYETGWQQSFWHIRLAAAAQERLKLSRIYHSNGSLNEPF